MSFLMSKLGVDMTNLDIECLCNFSYNLSNNYKEENICSCRIIHKSLNCLKILIFLFEGVKPSMSSFNNELINIVREHENPEEALRIAVDIITSFLEQSVSYQEPSVDFLQALG